MILNCKMCGGDIRIEAGGSTARCEYCGSLMTIPQIANDERIAALYNRANALRLRKDFDKAQEVYEAIASDRITDAEAYWGAVLCRFGIEYVEDPYSQERKPTMHRMQFDSILKDVDYLSALKYADPAAHKLYEDEARRIDKIQKRFLAIANKERPFDVFICYKETDNLNRRTRDSVYAQEIYDALVKEGYKVFFARVTLEDKLGEAYEPYIFAALNSAKAMLVVGTSAENMQSDWVKNEWMRYLYLMKKDDGKKLIPVYRDMDAKELPEEIVNLQSQDYGKIGAMQDLLWGLKKIVDAPRGKREEPPVPSPKSTDGGTQALLRRAQLFLEDGDFQSAQTYLDKVLDHDPECAPAYVGKVQIALKMKREAELGETLKSYADNPDWKKALRFAGDGQRPVYEDYARKAEQLKVYTQTKADIATSPSLKKYLAAIKTFGSLGDYKDAAALAAVCREKARALLETAYQKALAAKNEAHKARKYRLAANAFKALGEYKDAKQQASECEAYAARAQRASAQKRKKRMILLVVLIAVIAVGAVIYVKVIAPMRPHSKAFRVEAGTLYTIGLKPDGTVIATGRNGDGQCDVSGWQNIVAVAPGLEHTVGVKSDGTVVATGDNLVGQCDLDDWRNIVAAASGRYYTIGLKSDGTVVAKGIVFGYDAASWQDIVAVDSGWDHVVGLKSDGTVVAGRHNGYGQCEVSGWRDIVEVAAGGHYTVGLKSDGTVVATGENYKGECDVSGWRDIASIAAGGHHTVGLKSDGTVVATGSNTRGQCDVSGWRNIVEITAGAYHTIGLKSDGTVVATGDNEQGQCNVSGWKRFAR